MTWSRAIALAIWLGLFLRVGMACWNGLDGPSFGAAKDAANFHRFAVAISEGRPALGANLTAYSYGYGLAFVYRFTGPSLLLGSLISCVAWLASALLLRASLSWSRVDERGQLAALLLYSVLPSSVLWTSVTLREPYQLLGVNLSVLACLLILERRDAKGRVVRLAARATAWVLLLAGAALGAILHGALLMASALVVGALVFREVFALLQTRFARASLTLVAVIAIPLIGAFAFRGLYPDYNLLGGPAAAMEEHLRSGMRYASRTLYLTDPSIASNAHLVVVIPVAVFRYLFEPMPWKMNRLIDIGFLAENVLRALLIGCAFAAMWRLRGPDRRRAMLLLAWYFAIETTWAVGTFNWGTAARHHLPSLGLLLVAAGACWSTPRVVSQHADEATGE